MTFAIIFLAANLAWGDSKNGSFRRLAHLHSIGEAGREIPLDEKAVNSIEIQAGMDWGNFVVMDDANQRM